MNSLPNVIVTMPTNKWILASCLCLMISWSHAQADEPAPFYLFKDGHELASVQIMEVPGQHAEYIVKAVQLFCQDIANAYGVDVRMGDNPDVPNRIQLVVEDRPFTDSDRTDVTFPYETVMRVTGGATGVIRTLFALLEEHAGVRYLYQGGDDYQMHMPPRQELAIPREPFTRNSAFTLGRMTGRSNSYVGPYPDNLRYFWNWEVRLGAKHGIGFGGHDLDRVLFPLDRYREAEEKPPAVIFPLIDGERFLAYEKGPSFAHNRWQPCFTDPATLEEAVRNIEYYLTRHPQTTHFSLAVNDNGSHCECETCLAMDGPVTYNPMGFVNRSPSYYRWVNQLAERINAEYPELYFSVIAYREVFTPPAFELHPNVVVILCFDMQTAIDDEVAASHKSVIRAWGEKANHTGFWAYDPGLNSYTQPRIYFEQQAEFIRYFHQHKGGIGFSSGFHYYTLPEGPKAYLHFRLLEDPELEVEAVLSDWCTAMVGEAAAPHLRAYYAWWESYWQTKAIHTPWWDRHEAIYLMRGMFSTHMYGLERGDMAECRQIMETVLRLAQDSGSSDQAARAELLMRTFAYYEAAAIACGAELFTPRGILPDAATAVELLQSLPQAVQAFSKWQQIPAETPGWYAHGWITRNMPPSIVVYMLSAVTPFLDNPAVISQLQATAASTTLPVHIRNAASALLQSREGELPQNVVANGSFEEDDELEWDLTFDVWGSVSRTDEMAYRGDYALRCEIQHGNFTTHLPVTEAEKGVAYFASARIFIPADQAMGQGSVVFWGKPSYIEGDRPVQQLEPGRWHHLTTIIPGTGRGDQVELQLHLPGFEHGSIVYLDDVQLVRLHPSEN